MSPRSRLRHPDGPIRKLIPHGVRVTADGKPWRAVRSLKGAGPRDRVFVLKTRDDGSTEIVFGDGRSGARLPKGAGIVASYRVSGSSGNTAVYLDVWQRSISACEDGDLGESGLDGPDTGTRKGSASVRRKHRS